MRHLTKVRRLRRGAAAFLAAVLMSTLAVPAFADDIDDQRAAAEKKQQQLLAQKEKLAEELEDTNAKLAEAAIDLKGIEAKIPVAQAALDEANAKVAATEREAALVAQRLEDAQAEEVAIGKEIKESSAKAQETRASIAEMARQSYRGEGDVSTLGMVTGAQNTREFLEQYSVSSTAARSQSRTLDELQQAESIARNREARLTAVRETVEELKREADQKVAEAKTAQDQAEKQKATVDQLLVDQKEKQDTIEANKAAALAEMKRNDAAAARNTADLKAIVAQQRARDQKAGKSSQGSAGSGSGSSGSGSSSSSGKMLAWPAASRHVTSSYGMRFHPILHIWRLHAGTDMRARCGAPIMAARSGTVLYARTLGNGAKEVVVDHGWVNGRSLMTGYLHLTRWIVSPGQRVSQGQVVGYSGNTGVSAGCHLHFEVYINGSTVNPMSIL